MMENKSSIILSCSLWILSCLIIAGIEGWVTAAHINTWYYALHKPSFNPPASVFGPVWTVLYIMIGIAGGLIWHHRRNYQTLLIWFLIQLLFNFLWSFIFFAGHAIGWALIDIILLWLSLIITIKQAYQHDKAISYWLIPYFLWVSFAMILNFSLWILN